MFLTFFLLSSSICPAFFSLSNYVFPEVTLVGADGDSWNWHGTDPQLTQEAIFTLEMRVSESHAAHGAAKL